jgi:hypothetical protein
MNRKQRKRSMKLVKDELGLKNEIEMTQFVLLQDDYALNRYMLSKNPDIMMAKDKNSKIPSFLGKINSENMNNDVFQFILQKKYLKESFLLMDEMAKSLRKNNETKIYVLTLPSGDSIAYMLKRNYEKFKP